MFSKSMTSNQPFSSVRCHSRKVSGVSIWRQALMFVCMVLIGTGALTANALAQGFPADFQLSSLDGTNGFSVDPALDNFDAIASATGDINGDDIDDLIIGAGSENNFNGIIYVIFGSSSGLPSPFDLYLPDADPNDGNRNGALALNGSNGFIINGDPGIAFGEAGTSVSVGDINNDGADDVLIGAPFAGANGAAYVVFGSTSAFPPMVEIADLDGTDGFTVNGIASGDRMGASVGAGDINGDGREDLIVGAAQADPGGRNGAGTTYVLFGKPGPFNAAIGLNLLDGSDGFAIHGEAASDEAGTSVSSGDVNGDTIPDVVIGAPFGPSDAAYVVFGSTNPFAATLELSALDGTNGFKINGPTAGNQFEFSQFGLSVASGGDLNGDGADEVLIGAPFLNKSPPDQGGAGFVVFGSASPFGASLDVGTLDGSNGFVAHGLTESGQLGTGTSFGNPNGDGFADVIIGGPRGDVGARDGVGVTHVIFGKQSGFGAAFDLATLDGANGFNISGENNFDQTGLTVSGAGDINGDGTPDVVLSARSRQIGSVVYGIPQVLDPTTVFTSLLPAARGGFIGGPVITVFFSANNAGSVLAKNCRIVVPGTAPVTLSYQLTDAANAPVGPADAVFNLDPSQTRSFILAFTPNATSTGEDIFPDVACDNANVAAIPGVNTVFLSIDSTAIPDVLSIGATIDGNGIITVPVDGASLMTAAAINIGVGGAPGSNDVQVAVSADTGANPLNVTLTVCELNAASQCLSPPTTPDIAAIIGDGASFFAVFVSDNGSGGIPLDPANARVFLRFIEFGAPGAPTRSVTSAAVTVQ